MMEVSRFRLPPEAAPTRNRRPKNIRPKMSRSSRAKQFAPFAALGAMDEVLRQVEGSVGTNDPVRIRELSDQDAQILMGEDPDMDGPEENQKDRI